MEISSVGMFLDGLILILLTVTVFFAARLTIHLKVFRDGRRELETLVGNLSETITQAERSIEALREAAREAGRDLQAQINESNALSEELQLITEVGDGMANRLEKQAVHNITMRQPGKSSAVSGFAIPDSGFARNDDELMSEDVFTFDEEFDEKEDEGTLNPDKLHSRAERELYEALQGDREQKIRAGGV